MEKEKKFEFREGEELARRIREATNHGLGGVGRLDGGFASKVEEGCRDLNSGVAAITGMVESE